MYIWIRVHMPDGRGPGFSLSGVISYRLEKEEYLLATTGKERGQRPSNILRRRSICWLLKGPSCHLEKEE